MDHFFKEGGGATSNYIFYFRDKDGSSPFYMNGDGNVGVGTTTPNSTLWVSSGGSGQITPHGTYNDLVIENSTAGGVSVLTPDASNAGYWMGSPSNSLYAGMYANYNSGSPNLYLYSNGVKMTVQSSGNVGIGTTDPGADLHLYDGATNMIIEDSSTGSPNLVLKGIRSTANTDIGRVHGYWNGNAVSEIRFLSGADSTNKDDGQISFWTSPSASTVTEAMRINQNGNIGIGTTAPASNLEIAGGHLGGSGGGGNLANLDYDFSEGNSGSYIYTGFDVNMVHTSTGLGTQTIKGLNVDVSKAGSQSATVTLYSALFNGGNVGIGTTAPTSKLEVAGDISSGGTNYSTGNIQDSPLTTKLAAIWCTAKYSGGWTASILANPGTSCTTACAGTSLTTCEDAMLYSSGNGGQFQDGRGCAETDYYRYCCCHN
ncbi:MAG: hypothetical protein U9P50_02125 [Patescibacteria group bacterium]|nr:hypothetical protein [Patescibacteria group bacterium]